MPRLLLSLLCLCPLLTAADRQLFNGKDLAGWARIARHEDAPSGQQPGFVVQDGLLVAIPAAPEDDLWYTGEKIGNATLRVVYKVSAPNANSGVFIRIPIQPKSEDDAINKGIEVQWKSSPLSSICTSMPTCAGRSTRRPRPTAISAATITTSRGSAPTRPQRCAPPPASRAEPSRREDGGVA